MFGFSFAKILLLVAVVAIIWFGFRWFQRYEKEMRAPRGKEESKRPWMERGLDSLRGLGRQRDRAPAPPVEEMKACPACGTYLAPGVSHHCQGRR